MEYKENPEVDKLIKDNKIEEAIEKLEKEIMLNLLRVHNLFSDVKFSEDKLYETVCIDYGFDSDEKIIEEMYDFIIIGGDLGGAIAYYSDLDYYGEKYNIKDKLKEYMKFRKNIKKLYKKELKEYE